MKNRFKVIAIFILISMMSAFVSVSADTGHISGLKLFHDGASKTGDGNVTMTPTVYDGEKCLEFAVDGRNTNVMATTISSPSRPVCEKTILSFDTMAAQTTQYQFTQIIGDNNGKNLTIGEFFFSADGKMGYRTTPGWYGAPITFPDGTDAYSGYNLTDYCAGVWYHIDIVFDYAAGEISYYINGNRFGGGGSCSKTAPFSTFFVTAYGGGDYNLSDEQTLGNEKFYYDNIAVFDSNADEVCAEAIGVDETEKGIKVLFSEPIKTSLSAAQIINTETEGVLSSSVNTKNNIATFKYSGELADGTEYLIKLPEKIESKFDGSANNILLRFQTTQNFDTETASIVYSTTLDNTFDDETSTFDWTQQWSPTPTFTEEDGRGKVLNVGCNTVKPAATATDSRLTGVNNYITGVIDEISFDFKTNVPLNLSFTPAISGNVTYPYSFFISEKGWATGSDTAPSQSTAFFDKTAEQIQTDGGIAAVFASGIWYNVKMVIDKTENSIEFIVDGNSVGKKKGIDADFIKGIDYILIKNVSSTFNRDCRYFVDNILIRNGVYVTEPKVKNARITTASNTYGPIEDVDRALREIAINFYTEMDSQTLNSDTVSMYYGNEKINLKEINYSNKTLEIIPEKVPNAGDKIRVLVSGARDINGLTVRDYTTSFGVLSNEGGFEVSKFAFKDESGTDVTQKGGTLYADGALYNMTGEKRGALVSVVGYNNNKMTFIGCRIIELNSGELVTLGQNGDVTLGIENSERYDSIQISVDNLKDVRYPLIAPIEF